MPNSISDDLFRDFLNCKYKAFLKISGKCGQKSDYENLQVALLRDYRQPSRTNAFCIPCVPTPLLNMTRHRCRRQFDVAPPRLPLPTQ